MISAVLRLHDVRDWVHLASNCTVGLFWEEMSLAQSPAEI